MGSERGMVAALRDDVLGGAKLADALRKCLALGGAAGSSALQGWARKELRGYEDDETLPPYRSVRAPVVMDYINGRMQGRAQPVPIDGFEADVQEALSVVPLRFGVGELEAMAARGDSVQLTSAAANYAARALERANAPFMVIGRMYFSLSAATIAGVLDQIRTTLTELVVELDTTMSDEVDVPTADIADRALSIAVHGQVGQVVVQQTTGSTVQDGSVRATSSSVQDQQLTASHLQELEQLLPQLRQLIDAVPAEQRPQAEAQIATIEAQLRGGSPSIGVLHQAALALEQVSYSVAGSAVFETFKTILQSVG